MTKLRSEKLWLIFRSFSFLSFSRVSFFFPGVFLAVCEKMCPKLTICKGAGEKIECQSAMAQASLLWAPFVPSADSAT